MESSVRRCFPCSSCWDFILTDNDHESQVDNNWGGRDGASTSSGHQSDLSQENIERMSDGLYKFYEPTEASRANLDIFFFHALECEGARVQDAHISSWKSSSKLGEIWPQNWLSQDFPHSRIISISYDCCTKQTDEGGTMDMYRIAENLLQEIVWARQDQDCDRPVIFVGHGFGGIVMKQLCVYAHNRKENLVDGRDVSMFLDSIRGFFFYATPHLGVEGLKPPGKKDGPLLRWMYALNEELARLHEAFCKLKQVERYRWIIFAVGGRDSTVGRPGLRLREGSSRYGDNYITVSSSHFSVCRPSNKFSNEYLHLQTLIQDVLSRVELQRQQYLTLPKVMVGFDGLIAEVLEEHLRIHTFVGVCGMGGVGKTTLAKLIFNKACVKFEFTCFIEEVKGLTGPKSGMKKKVWEQLLHRGVPVRRAGQVHADEWWGVKGKSLLVIFDDVDSYQHTELLRDIADDNGCVESRFILTSRNSGILREVYGDDIHIIRLDHLGNEDAKKLLTAYAFPREQESPKSLRKIVQEVIDGCEGLPLTLEILGKHLRYQPTELWAEIPSALRRCTKDIADLEHRLWARLQLSYDGLPGNEAKNMFLDIASFFILNNSLVDDAVLAWSSIYGSVHNRLLTLVDRSLVTVRRYENPISRVTHTEFYMHEHLRRMGENIARGKGRSLDLSRIRSSGDPTSEDQNIFQGSKEELEKIVAHSINISTKSMIVLAQSCSVCIMQELWPKLAAIQFMELCVNVNDRCEQCRSRRVLLPSTLVLLRLIMPWTEQALTVEAGTNSACDMSGMLSLSTCTSLVKLELSSCKNLGELSRLQQLRVLIIHRSQGTRNWLTSLGELRRLEHLELFRIDEPFELPISFGHLTALQYLKISGCIVRYVPVSFTNLTNLRFLEMGEIVGRQAISVASFPQLRVFNMKCWAIADLAFRGTTALESLELELKEAVPDIFGHLENLRDFRLKCSGLENNLVESWQKMTCLEYLLLSSKDRTSELEVNLDLRSDGSLKMSLKGQVASPGIFEPLPVFLTSVEDVVLECEHGSTAALARNMINLKHLAVTVHGEQPVQDIFRRLRNLRKFKLVCRGVENSLMKSLGNMINLEDLTVEIQGHQSVPDIFRRLQKLRKFRLVCSGVENSLVESLGNMINLEDLTIEVQDQHVVRDIFGHLQNLRTFRLECSGMENNLIGSLGKLTSLEQLHIYSKHESAELQIRYRSWLPGDAVSFLSGSYPLEIRLKGQQAESSILKPLPMFLRKVDTLDLKCEHGAHTEVVRNMIHLESLKIVVEGPGAVPDVLGDLHKLRDFSLECYAVKNELEVSFGSLSSLFRLDLSCTTMERFPHVFGCFSTLVHLWLSCPSLQALPITVVNFSRLKTFTIHATGLQSLPDSICRLSQLEELSIFGCNYLTKLPMSLGQLASLVILKVRRCENLKTLPESVGHLSSLRHLDLGGSALHFLPDSLKNLTQLRELNISRCSSLDLSVVTEIFPQLEHELEGSYVSDESYDPASLSASDEDGSYVSDESYDPVSSSASDEE